MNWSLFISSVLSAGIRMGIPIGFAGIGVVLSEKSGVMNIGAEGEMLIGCFFTFAVTHFTGSILLGTLAGGLGGFLIAWIIAFLGISRHQNQSVVGIVVNIFMIGLTSFLFRLIFGTSGSSIKVNMLSDLKVPGLGSIPFFGKVFINQNIFYYVLIAVAIVSWYCMTKLKVGLQLRAVGENPRAAQACGIDVYKYRYFSVLAAGFLAGIGGAYIVVVVMGNFVENMSAGKGFIALAISALCHWNPLLALLAAFVFGITQGIQMRLQAYGINIPYQFLLMLPYIITILSLVLFARGVKAPKALGVDYKKEGR